MAKSDDSDIEFVDWDSAEWETAVEESGKPIDFSVVGSVFVGTFERTELIDPSGDGNPEETFNKHFFKSPSGEVFFVLGGFKLDDSLAKIPTGSRVRITYVGDVPMGVGKNPMKDYRIDVAKKK